MNDTHLIALNLRRVGKTYAEISASTGLGKSTLSWLFNKHMKQENATLASNHSKRVALAQVQSLKRKSAEVKATLTQNYLNLLNTAPSQAFVGYAIGLFVGEGSHGENTMTYLTNSDPQVIRAFANLCVGVLKLHKSRLKFSLYLHNDQNTQSCVQTWNSWLSPMGEIAYVYKTDNRPRKKKTRPNYHGTIRLNILQPNGLRDAFTEYVRGLERVVGFEPTASNLEGSHSDH